MPGVKLIDSTLVIVLHHGEQEIERELASPADALRVALMMLARLGRLQNRRRAQSGGAEVNGDRRRSAEGTSRNIGYAELSAFWSWPSKRVVQNERKAHAGHARWAQGAERQLMEEDQTNRGAMIKPPVCPQSEPIRKSARRRRDAHY